MNLDESESLLGEPDLSRERTEADERIEASMELLRSLDKSAQMDELSSQIKSQSGYRKMENCPEVENSSYICQGIIFKI